MKITEFVETHSPKKENRYNPNMNGMLVEIKPEKEYIVSSSFNNMNLDLATNWDEFVKCDEFSSARSVEFQELPFIVDSNLRVIEPCSIKITEGTKFFGRTIIYQVSFNEASNYNHVESHKPVFKNACLTPVFYDHETFEPHRDIVIKINPERVQDSVNDKVSEKRFREELHELLDEILDFPEAFTAEKKKEVVIRGYFENVESDTTVRSGNKESFGLSMDLSAVGDPNEHTRDYRLLFFFENRIVEGNLSMGLGKYYLPADLEDVLIRELGNHPSREQIEGFIRERGREDIIELNNSVIKS